MTGKKQAATLPPIPNFIIWVVKGHHTNPRSSHMEPKRGGRGEVWSCPRSVVRRRSTGPEERTGTKWVGSSRSYSPPLQINCKPHVAESIPRRTPCGLVIRQHGALFYRWWRRGDSHHDHQRRVEEHPGWESVHRCASVGALYKEETCIRNPTSQG